MDRKTIWEQIVDNKSKYIGKKLVDTDMGIYSETEITDIKFEDNPDNCYFTIVGKEFSCGFDIKYGGISEGNNDAMISFSSVFNMNFYIKKE
jgi:hypothetical protein